MKVLRRGPTEVIECTGCGSKIEFHVDDVIDSDVTYAAIKCPVCGKHIEINVPSSFLPLMPD